MGSPYRSKRKLSVFTVTHPAPSKLRRPSIANSATPTSPSKLWRPKEKPATVKAVALLGYPAWPENHPEIAAQWPKNQRPRELPAGTSYAKVVRVALPQV